MKRKLNIPSKALNRLDELIQDQMYEVYDNYPDESEQNAVQLVLEHVVDIIQGLDDDGEYEDMKDIASLHNPAFVRYVTACAKQEYNRSEYRWDRYAGL